MIYTKIQIAYTQITTSGWPVHELNRKLPVAYKQKIILTSAITYKRYLFFQSNYFLASNMNSFFQQFQCKGHKNTMCILPCCALSESLLDLQTTPTIGKRLVLWTSWSNYFKVQTSQNNHSAHNADHIVFGTINKDQVC